MSKLTMRNKKIFAFALTFMLLVGFLPIVSTTEVMASNRVYLESGIHATGTSSGWRSHPSIGSFTMGGVAYNTGISVRATNLNGSVATGYFNIAGQGFTRLSGVFGRISNTLAGSLVITCGNGQFLGGSVFLSGDTGNRTIDIVIPPGTQQIRIRMSTNGPLSGNASLGFGNVFFESGTPSPQPNTGRFYLESDIFATGTSSGWRSHPNIGPFTIGNVTHFTGISARATNMNGSTATGTFNIAGRGFTRLTGVVGHISNNLAGSLTITCGNGTFLGGETFNQGDSGARTVDIIIPPGTQEVTIRIQTNGPLSGNASLGFGSAFFEHICVEGASRVLTPATCHSEGTRVIDCAECHNEMRRESIPMTAHEASGSWVILREATCTHIGHRVQYCRICPTEVVLSEDIPINPTAHSPSGDWVTVIEPTCTETGEREQRCVDCNAVVLTESISALGHQLSGEWIIISEPTCSEVGERVQYCTRINAIALIEDIPTLPHTPHGAWFVTREPTCTVEGEEARECEVCEEIGVTRAISRLPHTPSGDWVIYEEPCCNTPGRRVQYCIISGSIALDEVIPAITGYDHVFMSERVSGNIFIPPIVTEYICEVCGYFGGNSTSFAMAWVSPAIVFGTGALAITAFKVKKKIKKGKKFVCPYCFEEHLVQGVHFRCTNLNCDDVDDIELTRYEGGNVSMPLKAKRTFPAPVSKNYNTPKHANCPDCNRKSSKVICPSCHNSLPESTLIGEDMIISIVGSRDVGKSHFIGVIINELIERVAGRFDGALTGFDDTMSRYEANFGRNLYVELTKLELTRSSTVNKNNGAYKPMIFTLTIKKSNKVKNYTLVFFDTAGEDLNEFDTMNTVNRYICKSAGVIFLLDPMQIWSVRNQLNDTVVSSASSLEIQQASRPDDIMTRVSRLIRSDKEMASAAKISIPVAAVFSKFDAIVPLIPPGSTILDPSPHCDAGGFVMADWHNVNSEIQSLLKTWGATAFVQQLELNYTNYSYFAASALGLENSPRSDGRIDRPRPHRIEDALLWILKENGVVDVKK